MLMKTVISELTVKEEISFDASRLQYHSGKMLAAMITAAPLDDSKILGITPYDLFVPVLTFVFGQAQLNSRAALFSTFRLSNEFYGLPHSDALFESRSAKEALHELGHTFGLKHCFDVPCVMNTSTYVEDIDLKPELFCERCMYHLSKQE